MRFPPNLNSNGYRGINTLEDLDNQPHQGYRLVSSQWPLVGVGFRLAIVVRCASIVGANRRRGFTDFLHISTRADFLIGGDFLIPTIYYAAFLPLAMCVITARLRLLALAILQNIFVLIAALIVMYVVFSLINGAQAFYASVQTGIAQSLFAAAFGSWLTWTPTRFYERNA